MKKRWLGAALAVLVFCNALSLPSAAGDLRVSARIYELFFGEEEGELFLTPGGEVFGVKIEEEGALVTEAETDGAVGLFAGDRILAIDGKAVTGAEEVGRLVRASGGADLSLRVRREDKEMTLTVTPRDVGGEYKLGILLKDTAAGIGTVTYYDAASGEFGGLGHGITENDTGELIPMARGKVTGVILGGAVRGEVGKPGELRGVLTDATRGTLYANTNAGVFGRMDKAANTAAPLPVARRTEVHAGEATIRSTIKNGEIGEYTVELSDVHTDDRGTKCFSVHVTDEILLALTGGIVRGMSGSPILQDGKLVGALTHVTVGDPTRGYGIFLENMLETAEEVRPARAA